jgi:hypothetical protein
MALTESLGIRLVLAELDAAVVPLPAAASRTAERSVRLKREGPDWLVEQSGRTLRWRNAVGMEMLAKLLREPGREFAALSSVAARQSREYRIRMQASC